MTPNSIESLSPFLQTEFPTVLEVAAFCLESESRREALAENLGRSEEDLLRIKRALHSCLLSNPPLPKENCP